jgi:hypothetical protein
VATGVRTGASADDLGRADSGGPLNFDLEALAGDARAAPRLFVVSTGPNAGVHAAPRLFVVSTGPNAGVHAAAYESAVEDLKSGHDVALVIETRAAFAEAWARTLAALQNGGVPTLALGPIRPASDRRASAIRWRPPNA